MQTVKIKSIKKIDSRDKYELEVADNANFFANGILKHNCRCIGIVDSNGDTTFYSRTGKEFDTLAIVRGGIKALNVTNVVFDGELCLVDEDGNEDFQGVMKQLKKKDHTIPNPSYKIFDMISHDEFYSKRGTPGKTYTHRYNSLKYAMKDNTCACLSVLEQDKINDDNHFAEWVAKANENSWEGLMLSADESYQGKM